MTSDPDDSRSLLSMDTENSRRSFIAGSAGAIGGFLLAGPGSVAGDQHVDEGNETAGADAEEVEPAENPYESDVALLNYALTLERLEAAFYEQALQNIDQQQLFQVQSLQYLDDANQQRVWQGLQTVQEHEVSHAETIQTTIEDLDGEVMDEPEWDFGDAVQDPQAFLDTAATLEDTGVGAYAGAAPYIENQDLVPPALGIHSVEARHAAFVRALNGQVPFPNVVDEALTREEVLQAAGGFIANLPEGMGDVEDIQTDDGANETAANDSEMDDDADDSGPNGNNSAGAASDDGPDDSMAASDDQHC